MRFLKYCLNEFSNFSSYSGCWMVPQSSRIWMLVEWNWCIYAVVKSTVPGAICRHSCNFFTASVSDFLLSFAFLLADIVGFSYLGPFYWWVLLSFLCTWSMSASLRLQSRICLDSVFLPDYELSVRLRSWHVRWREFCAVEPNFVPFIGKFFSSNPCSYGPCLRLLQLFSCFFFQFCSGSCNDAVSS